MINFGSKLNRTSSTEEILKQPFLAITEDGRKMGVFGKFDSVRFGQIRSDSVGFGQIGRIWSDWSGSVGFGRNSPWE